MMRIRRWLASNWIVSHDLDTPIISAVRAPWPGRSGTIMLDGCFIRLQDASNPSRFAFALLSRAAAGLEVSTSKGNVELEVWAAMRAHVAALLKRTGRPHILIRAGREDSKGVNTSLQRTTV